MLLGGVSGYALGLCGDPSRLGIKVSSAAAQRSDNSHLSPRTEPSRMVRPGIIQTLCASAVPARHAHQLLRAQCTPPRFGKASCFGNSPDVAGAMLTSRTISWAAPACVHMLSPCSVSRRRRGTPSPQRSPPRRLTPRSPQRRPRPQPCRPRPLPRLQPHRLRPRARQMRRRPPLAPSSPSALLSGALASLLRDAHSSALSVLARAQRAKRCEEGGRVRCEG